MSLSLLAALALGLGCGIEDGASDPIEPPNSSSTLLGTGSGSTTDDPDQPEPMNGTDNPAGEGTAQGTDNTGSAATEGQDSGSVNNPTQQSSSYDPRALEQGEVSSVRVVVVDETNAPIHGAEVVLNQGQEGEVTAITKHDGTATFPRMRRGNQAAQVQVAAEGMEREIEVELNHLLEERTVQLKRSVDPLLRTESGRPAHLVGMDGVATWCEQGPRGRKVMEIRTSSTDGFDVAIFDSKGALRRIMRRPGNQSNPRWSADGRSIVFHEINPETDDEEVWVANADTGKMTRVAKGMTAAWSPIGSKLLFAQKHEGAWNIVEVSRGSGKGNTIQLTDGAANDQYPMWGSWGSAERIAFASKRSGSYEIWAMAPDGSELTQLTRLAGAHGRAVGPQLHPDGQGLVFWTMDDGGQGSGIWWLPHEGTAPRRIVDHGSNPTWATHPKGDRVYFVSETTGSSQIFWIDAPTR